MTKTLVGVLILLVLGLGGSGCRASGLYEACTTTEDCARTSAAGQSLRCLPWGGSQICTYPCPYSNDGGYGSCETDDLRGYCDEALGLCAPYGDADDGTS